jgi:hypothetical protein
MNRNRTTLVGDVRRIPPDYAKCGGLTEVWRVAWMASEELNREALKKYGF